MTEQKDFIVAIELGSSKVTGIAGQKKPDGSISVISLVREDSSSFIRKGVVYNIDKTAQCLQSVVKRLENQLKTRITQVFVGVGGQSIHSVRNSITREMAPGTVITLEMVTSLLDADWGVDYDSMKILEVAEQEYRVDTQMQLDPVGIPATRLEGNYLNILQREAFFKNLNHCFEMAGVKVADMYLAPLALADAVLTETEKRSGCALVDIGADTTTVSVYSRNVLRHLAVIPLGSNNITKDIASMQMEESDAEQMKLKYASAYTDNNDIDPTLTLPVGASAASDQHVESRRFIEIVEARVEEIIENVRYQIPADYLGKLLGGIIITGGGSNMTNIARAFTIHTHIDKVRVAPFVTFAVNSSIDAVRRQDGTLNTVIGLLAKGNINCAGKAIDPNASLFDQNNDQDVQTPERRPRQHYETDPGVIRTSKEEELAAEEARKKKEEEFQRELQQRQREEEERERQRQLEAEERRRNSKWSKFKVAVNKFRDNLLGGEENADE